MTEPGAQKAIRPSPIIQVIRGNSGGAISTPGAACECRQGHTPTSTTAPSCHNGHTMAFGGSMVKSTIGWANRSGMGQDWPT